MKYLLILLAIFAIGCSPLQRVQRIYDNHPEIRPVSSVDTLIVTNDTIIYRDTTIFVTLPGDTVTGEIQIDTIHVPINNEPKDTLILESDRSVARAWLNRGKLQGQLINKELRLEIRLDSALRRAEHWEQMYINETKVVKEPVTPKWKDVMVYLAFIFIGLFVIIVIKKV